jgi:dephospho-CoA kinase
MAQSFVIVFAGVPGSSKSIVAYYLSETYSLPIFSTDNIRFEVKELSGW